ncbi:MAG: hypothetical protein ACXWF2_05800 [Usitatibacter sp.]
MAPQSALSQFKQRLRQEESRLSPAEGIDEMLQFFREERADGCLVEKDQDMLLYQWGTYDWGEGEWFELNITRQLIVGAGEDDDIWQLSLTFRFTPKPSLRDLPRGNRWCSNLSGVGEFDTFIKQSRPFQVVAHVAPASVKLRYECAG